METMIGAITGEGLIRIGSFAAILLAMALWELAAARRPLGHPKRSRWLSNLAIAAINALLVRLLLPAGAAVGVALWADAAQFGLFNRLGLPEWLVVLLVVVLLDLAIYLQHLLVHAVPLLWRLHMVHHADRDIDTSTGLRFHPLEILLSMLLKMGVVALLGAPAVAVIAFEVILNGMAMFNHGNVRLPSGADRWLRRLVVTPDMHRVHHSVERSETNSNYGFNLSLWDRLFGTYRPQPALGHTGMAIGLTQFRQAPTERLGWMLLLPFRGEIGQYPIFGRKRG